MTHPPLPTIFKGLAPNDPLIKKWVMANRHRGIKVILSSEHSPDMLAEIIRRGHAFYYHTLQVADRGRLNGERILEVVGPLDATSFQRGAFEMPIVRGENAQDIAAAADRLLDPKTPADIRRNVEAWLSRSTGVSVDVAARCLGALSQLMREGYNAGLQLSRANNLVPIYNLARGGVPHEQASDVNLGTNIHWERGCKKRTCCWTMFDY